MTVHSVNNRLENKQYKPININIIISIVYNSAITLLHRSVTALKSIYFNRLRVVLRCYFFERDYVFFLPEKYSLFL